MANTANQETPTFVRSGVCRLSYANVWQPKSIQGNEPKYSASILIPKTDKETVAKVKAAIEAAYRNGEGLLRGNGKSVPPLASIKTPLRDGDAERGDDPAYEGHWFLNATSKTAPGVVNLAREPITDPNQVYSGCFVRVTLNFYPFSKNGNRGVAAGLQNIQKVRDGERLGGRARAEDDFDDNFVDDYVPDDDFLA